MLAYLFIAVAVAFRLVSHPLAFTPVGASLLYFGARQPRSRMWLPVGVLMASDIVLTRVTYGYPLSADHFVTWAWYAAVVLLGGALRANSSPLRLVGAALATSVSFFLVSNFAVWAVWSMYPKTAFGLAVAYAAGIPFFRNEVAADLLFTAAMFGAGALMAHRRAVQHRTAV